MSEGVQGFAPLLAMDRRLQLARADSDTAFFFDLLYFGELIVKLATAGMVASLLDDKDRHRYRLEHQLVRADGIGDWVAALDDALVGPASQHLAQAAKEDQRAFTESWNLREDRWQLRAIIQLDRALRELDEAADPLPAKASLRRWFSTFATLRNRTRGHGAITAGMCSQISGPLEESLDQLSDNLPLFSRPWAYLHRSLSGKYRVVPLNGQRQAFSKLATSASYTYPNGTYVYFDGPAQVRLVFTDVDLSDFFLPNGGLKGSTFEVLSYATDERRNLDVQAFATPPTPLPPSETEGQPSLELLGKSFGNLPLPLEDYVSRLELERELEQILRDDRHPVITLAGPGGVGKTSLTLTVLWHLAKEGGYFAIVWCSARDIDLLPQGAKLVAPRILTREEIAGFYVELMQPKERSEKGFKPMEYLAAQLSARNTAEPVLFVIDNFETVRNPIDVYTWLDTVIRLPNKVLLTSRFRDFKGDYPLEVGGMSETEFDVLIKSTSERLGITHLVTDEFGRRLFDETDGHPYIGKIILGDVASAGKLVPIPRLLAGKDDVLDALFERSFQMMSPGAQRVFLTLCSWRSMAPRLAVEAALMRPTNERMDVRQAIEALHRSSLIEIVSAGDGEEFLRVPLVAAEFGRRRLAVSPAKSAVEADSRILQAFGVSKATDLAKGLRARVEKLFAHVSEIKRRGGSIDDYLPVLEYVAREYSPAWLKLADLYSETGQAPGSLQNAGEAIRRFLEREPQDRLAWQRLVQICMARGDVTGEIHARIELAELPASSITDISNAANRLNAVLKEKALALEGDERRILVERLKSTFVSRIKEADATDCSRLAWLCVHLRDYGSANAYVDRGLSLDPDNQHCLNLVEALRNIRRVHGQSVF